MRAAARNEYELKYTAAENYRLMMALYGRAISSRADAASHSLESAPAPQFHRLTLQGKVI